MREAYGGIVVNEVGRILLREVANHWDGYVWTFAKGRPGHGESPEDAALREVREELGVTASIVDQLPGVFKGGTTDTVYFVMSLETDHGDPDPHETSVVRWLTVEVASSLIQQTRNKVGRQRDIDVLNAYVDWRKSRTDPTPTI